ncbi:hypothetical protein CISG_08257 [Coccidioides immitis RMSCC 3703]|uniref:Uncharacterized protein n=1 Tax=Coccidioides immitis RMSCC 3703 TaxID=454286 RepID=A0A0J8R4W7_COCIT|nr:hypothetical protein CISG_08257 [Coccidioides immitis RMSCC 3703]
MVHRSGPRGVISFIVLRNGRYVTPYSDEQYDAVAPASWAAEKESYCTSLQPTLLPSPLRGMGVEVALFYTHLRTYVSNTRLHRYATGLTGRVARNLPAENIFC